MPTIWDIFSALDKNDPLLVSELKNLSSVSVPSGKVLLTEGGACSGIPFVLSGAIRVYKVSENGRQITLYRIEKGESCLLSGVCSVNQGVFPAMAETEEASQILFIPAFVHELFMERCPSWRRMILGQYGNRLSSVVTLVEEIAFRKIDQRLATLILDRGKKDHLDLTHQEIASQLGTTREVITRILKDFERQGWVETQRGVIKVLDAVGLLGLESRGN